MRLSIVAPIYNHAPFVEACVRSLADQRGAELELILIDDCSRDGSFEIAEDVCARQEIRDAFASLSVRRNRTNMGAAATINAGIASSRGDVVMIVNTDDLYRMGRVVACVKAISAGHRFVYTGVDCVGPDDRRSLSAEAEVFRKAPLGTRKMPAASIGFLAMNRAVSTGNFCFTRELYDMAGPFRELHYCHDWDFALRACLETEPHFIPVPYYLYRLHPGNSFRKLTGVAERESRICLRDFFDAVASRRMRNPVLAAFMTRPDLIETFLAQGETGILEEWRAANAGKTGRRLPQPPQPAMRPRQPKGTDLTVLVPNRDYARFLPERFASILAQTAPPTAMRFLDDASTDNSLELAARLAEEAPFPVELLRNDEPSGNVFRQWHAGLNGVETEFVWIAEADDSCAPDFLARLLGRLRADPDACFAFCDSKAIGPMGEVLNEDGKEYSRALGDSGLDRDGQFDVYEFLRRFLAPRNLVVNASAVVWRTEHLRRAFDRLGREAFSFECAGDWRIYVEACRSFGTVHYVAEPLNLHRRHQKSVTQTTGKQTHLHEIERIHNLIVCEFPEGGSLETDLWAYRSELCRVWDLDAEAHTSSETVVCHDDARKVWRSNARPDKTSLQPTA